MHMIDIPTYDVTPYLSSELCNARDFFVHYDRGFLRLRSGLLNLTLAMKTRLYTTHLDFFGANQRFDIKRKMQSLHGGAVVLSGADTSAWVDYSAPGNILFGYISAARGLDQRVCWAAGGILESLDMGRVNPEYQEFWFDNPGDKAAVDFGWQLFEQHPQGVNLPDLKQALTAEVLSQLQLPENVPMELPLAYCGKVENYPYGSGWFLNDETAL